MRPSAFHVRVSGLLLVTCLVAALGGLAAPALCGDDPTQPAHKMTVTTKGIKPPVRWADRHDPDRARLAIRTRTGNAELLLTRDLVALQLSDQGLASVRRQLRETREQSGAGNPVGWFESVLFAAVGSFLDHSAECDLADVREARYVEGRLVLESYDGKDLFEHIDVDDRDVLASFSPDDARRFVRKFHHLKGESS
jgi:hypothetical protein